MRNSKKRIKIIGIIIFSIILTFIIVAINTRKSNTYATEETIGTVKYTLSGTTLKITGTGTVTSAWKSKSSLSYLTVTAVTIADTIEGIGDSAFEGCTAIKKVTFNTRYKR